MIANSKVGGCKKKECGRVLLNSQEKIEKKNPIRLSKKRLVQKRPQLAQRTTEEYKRQDNQHSEVTEKGTVPKENSRRVEKSKNIQYSNYNAQIHCHGC